MEAVYRVTGPAAVERVVPLLGVVAPSVQWVEFTSLSYSNSSHKQHSIPPPPPTTKTTATTTTSTIDSSVPDSKSSSMVAASTNARVVFVWETTCEKTFKTIHDNALVLNRLHNTQILENKAYLAVLQTCVSHGTNLTTFIAKSSIEVSTWLHNKWSTLHSNISMNTSTIADINNVNNDVTHTDWWVVKSSKGNGGKDIWIVSQDNYQSIVLTLPTKDQFVIQKYVENPLLYCGKKFHYRCYACIFGDMSSYIYSHAFILTASNEYNKNNANEILTHITNLAVNKKSKSHPGQIPVDLELHPIIFANIINMWSNLVTAAIPFIQYQNSKYHYDFFGIDIIVDTNNDVWLLECNRLPGLQSSINNQYNEDELYNNMLQCLLYMVLKKPMKELGVQLITPKNLDSWKQVTEGIEVNIADNKEDSASIEVGAPNVPKHLNTFNWMAFHRRRAQSITV